MIGHRHDQGIGVRDPCGPVHDTAGIDAPAAGIGGFGGRAEDAVAVARREQDPLAGITDGHEPILADGHQALSCIARIADGAAGVAQEWGLPALIAPEQELALRIGLIRDIQKLILEYAQFGGDRVPAEAILCPAVLACSANSRVRNRMSPMAANAPSSACRRL